MSSSSFGSASSFVELADIIGKVARGDLIEVHRGQFRHWVMVDTVDSFSSVWCFHITDPDQRASIDTRFISVSGVRGKLRYEPLEDIVYNGPDVKPSLIRINNQSDIAESKLKERKLQKPDIDQVLNNLKELKDGVFHYDLKKMNCEHYCTLWKYGISWSSQVEAVLGIVGKLVVMGGVVMGVAASALLK